MAKLVVYTMKHCPYCESAKNLLRARDIPFQEVVVKAEDEEAWGELFKRSGMKTLPQIFAGEKLIGGYRELAELDLKDGLQSIK